MKCLFERLCIFTKKLIRCFIILSLISIRFFILMILFLLLLYQIFTHTSVVKGNDDNG